MKLNRLFFYFLLCTLSAPEAYANGKTINDLVQACDEGATAVEFGFCTGYILAAVESAENYISGFLLIALLAGGMLSIKQMQKPKEAAISNDVQAEFVTKPKNDENEDSFYIRCTHFRKTNSDDNAEQLELIEMVVTPSLKSAKLVSHDYGELKEYSDDVIAFEGIKAGTRMGFIINRGAATMSYNVNAIENGQVGRLLFKGWGTCERVKRENRV